MAGAQQATDLRKEFSAAGFEVKDGGAGSFEVGKNNCSCRIGKDAQGRWTLDSPPQFHVRGMACKLEDHGYQKFWYHEGKRFPIRLADLRTLHRFDEEVRYVLGIKSLYNESLGTTSARSPYDRMHGRPDR